MEQRTTKREILSSLLKEEVVKNNPMYKEFCEHEIELLDNKKNSKKKTEAQELNESLKEVILTGLEGTVGGMTVTDIQKKCNINPFEISNQRVTSVLLTLVSEGKMTKYADGKKSLYKLVA